MPIIKEKLGYSLFVEQVNHVKAVLDALNELDKNPAIDADVHHYISVTLNDEDGNPVGKFWNEIGPGAWQFALTDNRGV